VRAGLRIQALRFPSLQLSINRRRRYLQLLRSAIDIAVASGYRFFNGFLFRHPQGLDTQQTQAILRRPR